MPVSRETASSDSPRSSRMTISRLRVALQRWMTFGPAFPPGTVGSCGLFFGFSIVPYIWTIRCPLSSTADHPELLRLALVVGVAIARLFADAGYDSADNR